MTEDQNLNEMLKIRREKLKKLREIGRDPFKIEKYKRTAFSKEIKDNYDEYEGKEVSIAGRIMSKRTMGKITFIDVLDRDGKIQVYVKRDILGEEEYDIFVTYDIGDIVGVKGEVFKTKTNEISIKAKEITLLTKSLQILPEKWHGLKD
ncbi:MAG: lysine--tRNA ligase, partial [Clostridiaceae bacterium]|nr:lysine--tRNA ligase [Clostridiaceae bacterium]